MANCVYGFIDCAKAQRGKRLAADAESVDFAAAWREAEQELKTFGIAAADGEGIPAGFCSDDWGRVSKITAPKPRTPELEIKSRVRCFEHREKSFVFTDGTIWVSCSHDDCGFGKTTKRHSDRSPGGSYPTLAVLPDEMPVVESTDDGEGVTEVAELHAEDQARRVAGDDVDTLLQNIEEFFGEGSEETEPETDEEVDDDAE